MQLEGKGHEVQRHSRRTPTPTPDRNSSWYSQSGWQDWKSNQSWKETQGESEQRQYDEHSTSRGSDILETYPGTQACSYSTECYSQE
eukprot:4024263-Amphidinium_carterae.1